MQLMRDMLGVVQSGSANPTAVSTDKDDEKNGLLREIFFFHAHLLAAVLAQYEALGCDIEALDNDCEEFYAGLKKQL